MTDARLDAMARHMWDARRAREKHANLPDELKPGSIAEAYRGAGDLSPPRRADVRAGRRREGRDHHQGDAAPDGHHASLRRGDLRQDDPCVAGAHRKGDFVNLRIESEIALKLGKDMPAGAPWTADSVVPFVAGAMPAYELIEDRNAVYTEATRSR